MNQTKKKSCKYERKSLFYLFFVLEGEKQKNKRENNKLVKSNSNKEATSEEDNCADYILPCMGFLSEFQKEKCKNSYLPSS